MWPVRQKRALSGNMPEEGPLMCSPGLWRAAVSLVQNWQSGALPLKVRLADRPGSCKMLFYLCGSLLTAALLAGGGTHAGFLSDVALQLAAIPLLCAALWRAFTRAAFIGKLRGSLFASAASPRSSQPFSYVRFLTGPPIPAYCWGTLADCRL